VVPVARRNLLAEKGRLFMSVAGVADEPTANLDSRHGHEVMELLRDLARKESSGVVVVSHDPRLHDIADCVLWLEDGRLHPAEPSLTT
jgi:ABC-type lipoprotein export system ATPase subunit